MSDLMFGDVLKYEKPARYMPAEFRVMVVGNPLGGGKPAACLVTVICPWPNGWQTSWGEIGYTGDISVSGMVKEDE